MFETPAWQFIESIHVVLTVLIGVSAGVLFSWRRFNSRFKSDAATIAKLKNDISYWKKETTARNSEAATLQKQYEAISERLPEVVLVKFQEDSEAGNHGRAADRIDAWLKAEADNVGRILAKVEVG